MRNAANDGIAAALDSQLAEQRLKDSQMIPNQQPIRPMSHLGPADLEHAAKEMRERATVDVKEITWDTSDEMFQFAEAVLEAVGYTLQLPMPTRCARAIPTVVLRRSASLNREARAMRLERMTGNVMTSGSSCHD